MNGGDGGNRQSGRRVEVKASSSPGVSSVDVPPFRNGVELTGARVMMVRRDRARSTAGVRVAVRRNEAGR